MMRRKIEVFSTGADTVEVHGWTDVHPIIWTELFQLVCIYIYSYVTNWVRLYLQVSGTLEASLLAQPAASTGPNPPFRLSTNRHQFMWPRLQRLFLSSLNFLIRLRCPPAPDRGAQERRNQGSCWLAGCWSDGGPVGAGCSAMLAAAAQSAMEDAEQVTTMPNAGSAEVPGVSLPPRGHKWGGRDYSRHRHIIEDEQAMLMPHVAATAIVCSVAVTLRHQWFVQNANWLLINYV